MRRKSFRRKVYLLLILFPILVVAAYFYSTTQNQGPLIRFANTPAEATHATAMTLTVQNLNATFGGKSGITGQLLSEGGKDWNNPMNITLAVTPQSPATSINEYYVAFYDKYTNSSYTTNQLTNSTTFINDVKARINISPKNGFFLSYDVATAQHRVYDPAVGDFVNINAYTTIGYDITGCVGATFCYRVFPVSSSPPKWKIQFSKQMRNFNHTSVANYEPIYMYTAVYAVDNTGHVQFSSNITPVLQ